MSLPTTLTAALTLLAQHNEWRRGVSDDLQPTDARELGAAIDLVCEVVPELLAGLKLALPDNLCTTNPNIPDDFEIPFTATMGDMRQIATARAKAGGAA